MTIDEGEYSLYGHGIRFSQSQSTQTQKEPESNNIFGREGRVLVLQLLQEMYQREVEHTVERFELPTEFKIVAKKVWFLYLDCVDFFSQRPVHRLGALELVALQYLAARLIGAPILLIEFNMALNEPFPYLNTQSLVDEERLSKLTWSYRSRFTRTKLHDGALYKSVRDVRAALVTKHKLTFQPIEPTVVFYKLCRMFLAPPEIINAANQLYASFSPSKLFKARGKREIWLDDDLAHVILFACALKLYYCLDGVNRDVPPSREGEKPDLMVWRDFLSKVYLETPCFPAADPLQANFWDKETIEKYVQWSMNTNSKKLADRRLRALFPSTNTTPDFLNSKFPDPDVLNDLIMLLNTTQSPPQPVTGVKMGEQYLCFGETRDNNFVLPKPLECLHRVISVMLGTSVEETEMRIRTCEMWMRTTFLCSKT